MSRFRLGRREFETLVARAVESLPKEFKERLRNVAIVVEEEPLDEDYELTDTPDEDELLGIFRPPEEADAFGVVPTLPPQVVVFRGPILRVSSSREEALDEIRETVLHELGHHFGLDDHEMPY